MQQMFAELLKADSSLRVLQLAAFRSRNEPLTERLLALGEKVASLIAEVDAIRQEFPSASIETHRPNVSELDPQGSVSPKPRKVMDEQSVSASYPRFFREADKLVKIGWSGKKQSEYRHSCHIEDAVILGTVVAETTILNKLARFNELLPVEDCRSRKMLKYAIYAVLDWLRSEGLVKRHGHQGYSATMLPSNLAEEIRRRWEQLPERP